LDGWNIIFIHFKQDLYISIQIGQREKRKNITKFEGISVYLIYQTLMPPQHTLVFTSGKGLNLTSLEALRLAQASSKKFKHSVEPSFPILESSEAVETQSELITAPAYHIIGMSHFVYGE
jgi:hypothetical protein